MNKMTRREAVRLMGWGAAGAMLALGRRAAALPPRSRAAAAPQDPQSPPLAPGAPQSPERQALIEAFKQKSAGLEDQFEARELKSDWTMPYRLFRPAGASSKPPLVMYLCGSGGLGTDNKKQLELGNTYGTRVWLLPENQRQFPCYVVAPQTDRGWAKYDLEHGKDGRADVLPGLGDGSRLALEVIDALCREFSIDNRRIYVTGQSMGGAGVWNVLAARPRFFAAAVICCGSRSTETGAEAIETPLWAFHGDADSEVPVSTTRDRIAARRKAGGHAIYTEYAGVDHNCWQWAYTEPELLKWVFAQRRGA